MYAVIKTGGKQYRVVAGEKLKVEQIPADVGSQITIDQVFMVGEGESNNAMRKLRMKNCNCIVLNDTSAIGSTTNLVEVLSPEAETIALFRGTKSEVAERLIGLIESSIVGSGQE